jgi:hypothetical protein
MWDLQLVVFSEETVDVIEASLRFCSLSRTNFVRDELARGRGSVNFQDLHWFSDLTFPCSTILGFMACSISGFSSITRPDIIFQLQEICFNVWIF